MPQDLNLSVRTDVVVTTPKKDLDTFEFIGKALSDHSDADKARILKAVIVLYGLEIEFN